VEVLTPSYAIFAVLLALGFLLGSLLRKGGLSPAIGYLLAGLIIGFVLEVPKELSGLLTFLSEISILLLFFEIGFEIHITRLEYIRGFPLYISVLEMSLAAPITVGIVAALGAELEEAFVLGLIASFSSTVFTYKLLEEFKPSRKEIYRTVLMVAAVEDVIIVIALAMIRGTTAFPYLFILEIIAFGLAIFFLSLEFAKRVLSKIIRPDDSGLILIISYGLLLGLTTGYLGLSPALGAFIAGLTASSLAVSEDLIKMFKPVRAVFLVLFLVSMGLNISSISLAVNTLLLIIAYAVVISVIHTFSTLISSVIASGLGIRYGMETGFYLSTVSELALVIAYYATLAGVAPPYILAVAALSIIFGSLTGSYLTGRKGTLIPKFIKTLTLERASMLDDIALRLRRIVEGPVHSWVQSLFKTIMHSVGELLITLLVIYVALAEIYTWMGMRALIPTALIAAPLAGVIVYRLVKRTQASIHKLLTSISREMAPHLEVLVHRLLFLIIVILTVELASLIAIFRYTRVFEAVIGREYLGIITVLLTVVPALVGTAVGAYLVIHWWKSIRTIS